MSFRASLSVLLGFQFGQANKLLTAAEKGQDNQVKEVLQSKPQLAAFAGFHGTTSPLHRAAAAGHLSTCIAIIELIKIKIKAAEEDNRLGKNRSGTSKRWSSLLKTVLDQRTHRGQTALMLACDGGHARIAAYLLEQGADPLAVDFLHARTALHFAAIGGHAACVKVLCSESTLVMVDGNLRPLRDVVTADRQVQTAKYIDQRSVGGLTALHFAAVSGNLETLQALLGAGASIMVRTSAEAFIGQEYVTPGSTPLHIAVLVGSMPLAHAILHCHAELMSSISATRDERRRRPWEGHSRSDIRSVRNTTRKLPYHLARDRHWSEMMHLVDPRVPIDAALDAARDTEHGIGPKNLSTICSIVLQESLLSWLDKRETELEAERSFSPRALQHNQTMPPPPTSSSKTSSNDLMNYYKTNDELLQHINNNNGFDTPPSVRGLAPIKIPAATEPAISSLAAAQNMSSLHAYVAMLSLRRPTPFEFQNSGGMHRSATVCSGDLSNLANLSLNPPSRTPSFSHPNATNTMIKHNKMHKSSSTGALARLGLAPSHSPPRLVFKSNCVLQSHQPLTTENTDLFITEDCKSIGCGSCSDNGSVNRSASDSVEEIECGVCLDHTIEVAFSGCEHALCLQCARNLTKQEKKPPICPFCRRMVVGFLKVSSPLAQDS